LARTTTNSIIKIVIKHGVNVSSIEKISKYEHKIFIMYTNKNIVKTDSEK
jgi:hypothetical protein